MENLFVRGVHPSSFRSGQWAHATGVAWHAAAKRPVLTVKFVDGVDDEWAVFDEPQNFEFSDKVTT